MTARRQQHGVRKYRLFEVRAVGKGILPYARDTVLDDGFLDIILEFAPRSGITGVLVIVHSAAAAEREHAVRIELPRDSVAGLA